MPFRLRLPPVAMATDIKRDACGGYLHTQKSEQPQKSSDRQTDRQTDG